jgi:predicted transcriptional regulator
MTKLLDAEPYKLTPRERDEIDAALAEVERGELASEEEVTALVKRWSIPSQTG